jgi:hypothetical protein
VVLFAREDDLMFKAEAVGSIVAMGRIRQADIIESIRGFRRARDSCGVFQSKSVKNVPLPFNNAEKYGADNSNDPPCIAGVFVIFPSRCARLFFMVELLVDSLD